MVNRGVEERRSRSFGGQMKEISKRIRPIRHTYPSILDTRKYRPKKVNRISKTPSRYNILHNHEVNKNTDLL